MKYRPLLFFLILASLSFFYLKGIPNGIIAAGQLGAIAVIIIMLLINWIYGKDEKLHFNFKVEMSLLLVAVGFSMFGAGIFHGQDLVSTLYAQKAIYFLLVYFLLHSIKVHPDELVKISVIFSIVYSIIYILQFLAYPVKLISNTIMVERGTIRIFLPGGAYSFFIYFFALSKYFLTKNFKYILLATLMLIIFVLLGSRQLLGSVVFLTFMFLLLTKQVKSKFAIFFIIALSIFPLYLAFENVISGMVEVSMSQSQDASDNVRLRAAKFFIYDFFPNKLSYVIGNGASGNHTDYGRHIQYYMANYGFFQSDIGLIGEFSKFGIVFILAELIIIFKGIFMKLPPEINYIRFIFLGMLMMSFTGGGGFSEAESIVNACILLYIIDAYKTMEVVSKSGESDQEPAENINY